MKRRNRPIGIFDSGIGGLTVVKEIIQALPNEDIVYFGDTARVPYGNKSAQTIIGFSVENVKFLLKFGVKLIIVACNTSSSLALPALRTKFKLPILGVISSAVRKAVKISPKGRIGIIATRATVKSRCYQREIKKIERRTKAFVQACPLFVPLVEEGWTNERITLEVAQRYLAPLLKKDIDTLILGCTHYPLLKNVLRKTVGKRIKFVDSAEELTEEVKTQLRQKGLTADKRRKGRCRFYVSDEPIHFQKVGRRFLEKRIKDVYAQGPVIF